MQPLYLEDLFHGQRFRSRAYEITARDIKLFAQRFDPQAFHMDEAAAEGTFFRGLAASGWHTTAITMRLMVESVPIVGGLIGAGVEELKWHRPVRPEDQLTVEVEVIGIRESKSKPNQGLVRVRSSTFNQRQELVQDFVSTIVVPKRDAGNEEIARSPGNL